MIAAGGFRSRVVFGTLDGGAGVPWISATRRRSRSSCANIGETTGGGGCEPNSSGGATARRSVPLDFDRGTGDIDDGRDGVFAIGRSGSTACIWIDVGSSRGIGAPESFRTAYAFGGGGALLLFGIGGADGLDDSGSAGG